MRNFITFLLALGIFLSYKAHAQLKPAEGQYSVSAGAFINPSFEQGYKGWTVTGCTKSLESDVPYLNKTLKLACTADTFSIKQEVTSLVGLEGNQGLLSCRVKATAPGVRVRSLTNGVETSSIEVVSGAYKKIEIPTKIGATSNGNEILVDSSYTGDVFIDECIFTPAPAGYVSSVDTSVTDWESCTFTMSWNLSIDSTDCKKKRVGDEILVRGVINFNGTPNAVPLTLNVADGLSIDTTKMASSGTTEYNFGQVSLFESGVQNRAGRLRYTGNATTFEVIDFGSNNVFQTVTQVVPFIIGANDKIHFYYKVPIQGWSSTSNTIVSQEKELTAQTANELSFVIDTNGVVLSENYDVINGNCTNPVAGSYDCTLNTGIFTASPSCVSNGRANADIRRYVSCASSPTTINLRVTDENGANINQDLSIVLSKQGADVNKSQVITGTFENINSSELVDIKYYRATAQSIPSAVNTVIIYNQLERDNSPSEYNPSTGVYTNTKDYTREYHICGAILFDNFLWNNTEVVELQGVATGNNTSTLDRPQVEATQTIYKSANGCSDVKVPSGGTITFNVYQNGATKNLVPLNGYSFMSIKESATTESIIKNLNDNNNVECQTKYLSASTSAGVNGYLSDLAFNNLTVGKKYSVTGYMVSTWGNASENYHEIQVENGSGASDVCILWDSGASGFGGIGRTCKFTAITSTLEANLLNVDTGNSLYGDGGQATSITLCELPDNTILNSTKFN
tara:strand:+ start:24672 stop:26891 length:2220 start_codon:yes stop_codon:yes gene_type:complete